MLKLGSKIFDIIFSEFNRKKIENFTIWTATLGFIFHLSLVLLNNNSIVTFTIKNPEYRPVNASADSEEVKNIKKVIIKLRKDINIKLLHDPEDNMENRHLKEQFLID